MERQVPNGCFQHYYPIKHMSALALRKKLRRMLDGRSTTHQHSVWHAMDMGNYNDEMFQWSHTAPPVCVPMEEEHLTSRTSMTCEATIQAFTCRLKAPASCSTQSMITYWATFGIANHQAQVMTSFTHPSTTLTVLHGRPLIKMELRQIGPSPDATDFMLERLTSMSVTIMYKYQWFIALI